MQSSSVMSIPLLGPETLPALSIARMTNVLAPSSPYVTVLVELPHADGRRVLGILADDIETNPEIGDRVVGVFEHSEGAPWPLLRWRRAATAEGEKG